MEDYCRRWMKRKWRNDKEEQKEHDKAKINEKENRSEKKNREM